MVELNSIENVLFLLFFNGIEPYHNVIKFLNWFIELNWGKSLMVRIQRRISHKLMEM